MKSWENLRGNGSWLILIILKTKFGEDLLQYNIDMEVGIEVFAWSCQKNFACFLRENVTGFKRVTHEDADQEKSVFFSHFT